MILIKEKLMQNNNKNIHVRTLRRTVIANKECAQKFEEAETLAKSLYRSVTFVPLPYFTQHGEENCKSIEKYLDQIIWGTEKESLGLSEYDFIPTPEEAMYLLSAVWLHDIGMMYGIFEGEDAQDLVENSKKVMMLHNEHEFRTASYIHDLWKLGCSWLEDEKTCLTNICVYHRQRHPLSKFDPLKIISKINRKTIRLVILAALLRLADALHVDQYRAPSSLTALYMSLGMSREAIRHWERARLIMEVEFDHTNRKIILTGYCPPKFNFNLGLFDLGEIVEIVRQDIEKVLRSVEQVLLPYPNTYFGEVKHHVSYPLSLKIHKEQYLALWPYLLDKPSSSTEAAASLVNMLLFAVKEGKKTGNFGKVWRDNFSAIINGTEKSRPFDFMIRNLRQGVEDILKDPVIDEKSADKLTRYFELFLNRINGNYLKIAELARDENIVGPKDVLVVHGYSTNNATFLEKLVGQHEYNNSLYIVEYVEPIGKVRLGPDENERLITFANKLGFEKVRCVSLAALAQVMAELMRRHEHCKVLISTHGVLKSKDFLCKVGSYVLADMAKRFEAKVIVFADTAKFLINGESDKEVAGPEKLFSSEQMCTRHPTMINTMCLTPEVDFVPKELVNWIVTEKGVFKSEEIPFLTEQLASEMGSGKKKSNRR